MPAPAVGAVVDGYRFKGGNPRDKGAWERVGPVKPPKLSVQEQKQLQTAREAAVQAQGSVRDGERFLDVNRKAGTGEIWSLPIWFNGTTLADARSAFDSNFGEMNALTSRMAPMQRQPGSGSSSDKDVAMFKQSVPNPEFTGPTNTKIVRRLKEEADLKTRYATFLDDYVAQNGTLVGAQAAWEKVRVAPKPAAKPKTQGNGWTIKEVR